MNADVFLDAVGKIDDRFLDVDMPRSRVIKHTWRKRLIAVAASLVLLLGTLPTLTALGVYRAYDALYAISPAVAQTFKPVQKSCEDNGIEMTVISAECKGSTASVCLAMHDISSSLPDGEWDLYDSYRINVPYDMTAHCSFSEYDNDTDTAYFVVHLETMDGRKMPQGKVTFSVSDILVGKRTVKGEIEGIDMADIPYEPKTKQISGISGSYSHDNEPAHENYRFLVPGDKPFCTPTPGVNIVGIGYFDGALHILTEYDDALKTDNHGYISLVSKNGDIIGEKEETGFYYRNEAQDKEYMEQIIPVAYDELKDCTLYGDFVTAADHVSGKWQVTFPLE